MKCGNKFTIGGITLTCSSHKGHDMNHQVIVQWGTMKIKIPGRKKDRRAK